MRSRAAVGLHAFKLACGMCVSREPVGREKQSDRRHQRRGVHAIVVAVEDEASIDEMVQVAQ